MKKFIIVSLLFVSLLSAPVFVQAQSVPTQQELTQQLIVLLTEMIKMLQQQIADILASQAAQTTTIQQNTQTIQSQSSTIQQIQQNTQQIVQPLTASCSASYSTNDNINYIITYKIIASGGPTNGKDYQYYWNGLDKVGSTCNLKYVGQNNDRTDKIILSNDCNGWEGNNTNTQFTTTKPNQFNDPTTWRYFFVKSPSINPDIISEIVQVYCHF